MSNKAEIDYVGTHCVMLQVSFEEARIYISTHGIDRMISDLSKLNEAQTDIMILLVHGMVCADGPPNSRELEYVSIFMDKIGISEDRYINVVKKSQLLTELILNSPV